jgi:hypothetical protein
MLENTTISKPLSGSDSAVGQVHNFQSIQFWDPGFKSWEGSKIYCDKLNTESKSLFVKIN